MFEFAPQTYRTFSHYPLAWLSGAFALGILAGNYFQFDLSGCLIVCLISAIIAVAFDKRFAGFALIISFAALGALCLQAEKQSVAPNRLKILYDNNEFISGDPVEISGVLNGKPELAVGGFFIELKAEKARYENSERAVSGNVRFFAPVLDEQSAREYEQLQLNYGARLRVACRLRREDSFLNPGVVSFKKLLDQKGIDAAGTIKSPLLIENIGDENIFQPLAWVFERRQDLITDFQKTFSVSTAGVLIASMLGNRYHLDKETSRVFREGGIFHLLVISGLHITFIGGLLILLTRAFTRRRFLQFIIPNVFLWFYAVAVGGNIPVVRAALMFTILHFASVIFRQATLLNTLGLCALILLAWRPSDLFDQSLQLTFASVAAIVAMAFPMLEKIKAIGEWRPNVETPIPPECSKNLKIFCESLYWSERGWQNEISLLIWEAKLFKTPYAEKLERHNLQKPLRYIFEIILISAVVQIWMIPFMVVYFHRISFAAIFLNVWAGMIIALESLAALAAVFALKLSDSLAIPFIKLTEIFNWILINIGSLITENNWSNMRLPHYAGSLNIIYVLYFLPVIAVTLLIYQWKPFSLKTLKNKRKIAQRAFIIRYSSFTAYLLLTGLIIFHPLSAPSPDGRLHIDFLDVGQGDSALITMPTGETLLVDGGGKPIFNTLYVKREDEEPEPFEPDAQRIGEAVVSAFLWEKGYDRIDYILATHADADHIQGLADVARNFKVKGAIFGRTPLQNIEFANLYEVLQNRNIPILKLSRGQIINFGEAEIEVFNPEYDENPQADSDNDRSLVLRVNYGKRNFLLTGDIEKEAENEILKTWEFLQSDVVKVAHHGSKTSSAQNFINAVQAKIAVIPVGKESPFGHPKPEIVERWKAANVKVLTTGENGTISFSTDGNDLQLKTFTGKIINR